MIDLHVRFEEDRLDMLKIMAEDRGTSVAEVIRNCVDEVLGITRLEEPSNTIEDMNERITQRRHIYQSVKEQT